MGALAGVALADLAHIISDFQALYENVTGFDRIFSGAIANSIATMNEMGCHCFFDEDFNRGHIVPIDALDQLCKNLNNCYQCAQFDGEVDGNDECAEPFNVSYSSGVGASSDIYESCKAANGGD